MKPIVWKGDSVLLIDQRALPLEEVWLTYHDANGVADAIRAMVVRGAPAIGVAAAFGLALEAKKAYASVSALLEGLETAATRLRATRPTAVNLAWALDRMLGLARSQRDQGLTLLVHHLEEEARAIAQEDEALCRRIGKYGAELLKPGVRVLTHCNAGALATSDYGTALGVIRSARAKIAHVWVDETRPFLQGARLTAWELLQEKIPCTLICDNMAAYFMQQNEVDVVLVGADRITAMGAIANKIGTYNLAVLCHYHQIPFYVAAPYSTIDLSLIDGQEIPIEERSPIEVTHWRGVPIAPLDVPVANPAFDVTPPELITAIITDRGVVSPPFKEGLACVMNRVESEDEGFDSTF